jgi:hypothetical protein
MFKLFLRSISRADKNERNYTKWLSTYVPETTSQRIELTRCYTDRNDNNFYILKNPANLTRERAQRIEEAILAIDYGIKKDDITERINKIKESIQEMPWQSMTRDKLREFHTQSLDLINDLLYRMKSIKVDDLIIEAGMYFLYIDGENPYIINSETLQRKRDAIDADDELRAFFLNTMEQILNGLSTTKH